VVLFKKSLPYRGRLAPTPSGFLHLGHARTFWFAQQRAQANTGVLVLRNEDLDQPRCKSGFVQAMLEDLRWFGFEWQEGPDTGGSYGPYNQSDRQSFYLKIWKQLHDTGSLYPSPHSRKDVEQALSAPHHQQTEAPFPKNLRPPLNEGRDAQQPGDVNWRFRVPDGETIQFDDGRVGTVTYEAGKNFGDFIIWRKDGFASYDLAVCADDHAMQITEVVRGEDLLVSTARQLLIYRALKWTPPQFFHCPLMLDDQGKRLAKRHDAMNLQTFRKQGRQPADFVSQWQLSI